MIHYFLFIYFFKMLAIFLAQTNSYHENNKKKKLKITILNLFTVACVWTHHSVNQTKVKYHR